MNAAAVILRPVRHGWVVAFTDGWVLARFTGPGAKGRAIRYIAQYAFTHAP